MSLVTFMWIVLLTIFGSLLGALITPLSFWYFLSVMIAFDVIMWLIDWRRG